MKDVDVVIGKQLAVLVPRGKASDSVRKWRRFLAEMGWKEQTYYEARSGRRMFRVDELVAMARACEVPVWTFLDGTKHNKTLSIGDGRKAKAMSTAELLDLFQSPTWPGERRARLTMAIKVIRTQLANLIGIDAAPPEGGMAHQLHLAARLIEQDTSTGGSK